MSGSTSIIHVVQGVSFGGACRAAITTSQYLSKLGSYSISILPISRRHTDENAEAWARAQGVNVIKTSSHEELLNALSDADIVHLHWWNNPELDALLRSELPPMRLVTWFHVGGHKTPQIITSKIINYVDMAVACSPYTYDCPAIQEMPPAERLRKCAMVYGSTDLHQLSNVTPKPHAEFNVGYIGTVNFLKMNPRFVEMSAAINIPNIRFLVCGSGGDDATMQRKAAEYGLAQRFDFKGYVQDVRTVLEIMDVYGYPLCEDTYAASEINLQEVMWCGIPVVTFPYGGIKNLIVNDFTGYLVRSEFEYAQAIEFLYHHPEERLRLGQNAKTYAAQLFGSDKSAKAFHSIYQKMLSQSKRSRSWDGDASLAIQATEPPASGAKCGAEIFIETLGEQALDFELSLKGGESEEVLGADQNIKRCSTLMRLGGISAYRKYYSSDPHLCLWSGLAHMGCGDYEQAITDLSDAVNNGFTEWRIRLYLAQAALHAGRRDLAAILAGELHGEISKLSVVRELMQEIENTLVL